MQRRARAAERASRSRAAPRAPGAHSVRAWQDLTGLPDDAPEDEQVAALVERAKLGDFDELHSSSELRDYLSPEPSTSVSKALARESAGSLARPSGGAAGAAAVTMQRALSPADRATSLEATVGSYASGGGTLGEPHTGEAADEPADESVVDADRLTPAPRTDKKRAAGVSTHSACPEAVTSPPARAAAVNCAQPQAPATLAGSAQPQPPAEQLRAGQHASQSSAGASITKSSRTTSVAIAELPEWVAQAEARSEVQAAVDLHGKMAVARGLPTSDMRRPLWLAAVTIKATQLGIDAAQSAQLFCAESDQSLQRAFDRLTGTCLITCPSQRDGALLIELCVQNMICGWQICCTVSLQRLRPGVPSSVEMRYKCSDSWGCCTACV